MNNKKQLPAELKRSPTNVDEFNERVVDLALHANWDPGTVIRNLLRTIPLDMYHRIWTQLVKMAEE